MSARPFSPVWLALPGSNMRRVDNAYEALECLLGTWPITTGPAYRKAVTACRDALDGFAPPTKARRLFLAAAKEIGAVSGSAPLNPVQASKRPAGSHEGMRV